MVTVVVPVYNVESYIDRCVESIVNQTYRDLEILLVNDGSTDASGEKCLQWANRDKRIKYVFKHNEGPGPTRNLGIRLASSEVISFIDSDDWIDVRFIELMYAKMIRDGSDIVACDICRVYATGTQQQKMLVPTGNIRSCFDMIECLDSSACNKLFRKQIFTKNNILFAYGYLEDMYAFPLLMAYANKVSHVEESLYFYYRGNRNSIMASKVEETEISHSIINIINILKARNFYDAHMSQVKKFASVAIYGIYSQLQRERTPEVPWDDTKQHQAEKDTYRCFSSLFDLKGDVRNSRVLVWGSFNLRQIVLKAFYTNYRIRHYSFSSIISAMSEPVQHTYHHKNWYRDSMIQADLSKLLRNGKGTYAFDYVLIDFLEERFDIGQLDGSYYTISDAVEDICDQLPEREIAFNHATPEYFEAWKKSCDKWVEFLLDIFSPCQIVLIKNKLMCAYGEYGKESAFENENEINEMNNMLEMFYTYFSDCIPGIHIIEPDYKYLYTDKSFRYGCFPWHMNDQAYYEIAHNVLNGLLKI